MVHNDQPLSKIVGEIKSFTSTSLKKAIIENKQESRKEWLVWMMERAGKKNGNNRDWQLWQQNNQPLEIYSESLPLVGVVSPTSLDFGFLFIVYYRIEPLS